MLKGDEFMFKIKNKLTGKEFTVYGVIAPSVGKFLIINDSKEWEFVNCYEYELV